LDFEYISLWILKFPLSSVELGLVDEPC
jgi:hypothetical protein